MRSVAHWIEDQKYHGRYTFTREEALKEFPEMASGTFARALTREVSKGRIMSPLRGFYVIVPDEYVLRGTVPQSFYLDELMHHLGRNYYVSLLSAGTYHGASHQVPLVFSVMIEPPAMRDKYDAKYHTAFFCKKDIPMPYVERRQTRSGFLNVSSPELTSVDLITYQENSGGLTRAATVLAELADKVDFEKLSPSFIEMAPTSSFQRLGYILEEVLDFKEKADTLYALLKKSGVSFQSIPLKPGKSIERYRKNMRWKIIENETIEIDDL